jgi:hypothetical protein
MLLCSPQIPHVMVCDRTHVSIARAQQLPVTASATAPHSEVLQTLRYLLNNLHTKSYGTATEALV